VTDQRAIQPESPAPSRVPEHGASARDLFLGWLALMLLAGISFAFRFAPIGVWGYPVGLGIAIVKALIVALVFMELPLEKFTVKIAFLAGVALLAVMMALMLADIVTRDRPPLGNPPGTAQRYRG
jgi:cytochrome c oxidase subunit 4